MTMLDTVAPRDGKACIPRHHSEESYPPISTTHLRVYMIEQQTSIVFEPLHPLGLACSSSWHHADELRLHSIQSPLHSVTSTSLSSRLRAQLLERIVGVHYLRFLTSNSVMHPLPPGSLHAPQQASRPWSLQPSSHFSSSPQATSQQHLMSSVD